MQSRVTPLAFPGSDAGLAEVKVWVNLWCYSGLGSWYELPYINPSRVLGQG
ncbi:methionine sulfoxide reductase B1 [Columba livia]|uniref:Methionine sulfoxide reductase B1 n=1 Tax=Columba livia TaxID=8932 RepID=A0A2I0LTJ8_COLLI|nr:methionine sulfoxide reductase B1 [Columba livia]